jgi:hypothetical protein
MKGVDLRSVQAAMGHKTIQMTCRYAHLAPEHELAVVEKLCETEVRLEEATGARTDTSSNEASIKETVSLQ